MALDALATTTDLDDRGIDTSDPTLPDVMLDVASASVRAAAGVPISQATSTVTLDGWGDTILRLPGAPVTAVASVSIDGDAVTDYKVTAAGLWRSSGWGHPAEPAEVEVTYTHGLVNIPPDIVDLVCNLAAAGMAEAASLAAGGSFDPRVVAERIDDYYVQYAAGAEAVASVMDLPAGTRARLSARFGGSADLVESR